MFNKTTYIDRRKALTQKVNGGIILLPGNEESSINFADNWYHFRQDSNFLYYFGLSHPGLMATIDCESGEECIYGDDLTIDDIVWTGPQPTVAELGSTVGVNKTKPLASLEEQLKQAIASGRTVHICPPYRDMHLLQISQFTGWPIDGIKNHVSATLIEAIVSQRMYKSAEEIVEIDRAATITSNMHAAAMQYAQPGMKEYEVVSVVQQAAIAGGGHLSFPIILTKDGQTLHNHYHGNTLQEGDMVLCDAGAETAMGYAGDMTRTFPVGKKFTPIQQEMYHIVLNAHETAIAALKPGIAYKDVHLLASETLFEGLKSVGLTKGDTKEAVQAGAHTMFFQCGLGHMMGLDVHDMENLGEQFVGYTEPKSTEFGLKSLRLGRKLEAGFVLTVEPGIYIIPQLIDMWKAEKKYDQFLNYDELEKFKNFGGIRVEEDFVITEDGYQLLGKPLAKTIEDIHEMSINLESLIYGDAKSNRGMNRFMRISRRGTACDR